MLAPSTGGSSSPVRSPPYQVRAAYRGSHGWGHASTDSPARSAVRSSGGAGSAEVLVVGVVVVDDAAATRGREPSSKTTANTMPTSPAAKPTCPDRHNHGPMTRHPPPAEHKSAAKGNGVD